MAGFPSATESKPAIPYGSKLSRQEASGNKESKETLQLAPLRGQLKWLDLTEEVGSNWLELLLVGIRIQKPQGCRQAAEQGVSVLGSKAGSDNLFIASHRQALSHDDRLIQNPSKQPVVATEGKHRSGGLFVR